MKKVMLLATMLFLSTANIFSQETYKSLLTEGKTWEVVTTNTSPIDCEDRVSYIKLQDDFSKAGCQVYQPVLTEGRMWKLSYSYRNSWQDVPDAYMTISVDSDFIVDGKTCKKLLVDYRNLAEVVYPKYIVAYESNGKVYRIDEDGERHLVMDMSLHKGDVFDDINVVLKEDYIVIDGVRRKRLMIDSGVDHANGEYIYYMVEGIGLSKDEFVRMGLMDDNIYFHRLIACYDNGKCIFSAADFPKEGTSGLTTTQAVSLKDNISYDMQGRKRSDIKKGEIFIQNGKKHINGSPDKPWGLSK